MISKREFRACSLVRNKGNGGGSGGYLGSLKTVIEHKSSGEFNVNMIISKRMGHRIYKHSQTETP